MRTAKVERNTKETQISVELNLDGTGKYENSTGIGFLDHMLDQLSRHSLIDLKVQAKGYLIWNVEFSKPKLGDMDTELFREWFQAFSQSAGITLHVENLYGTNNHHIIESCYKGLARALRQAIAIDERKKDEVPSTKGKL